MYRFRFISLAIILFFVDISEDCHPRNWGFILFLAGNVSTFAPKYLLFMTITHQPSVAGETKNSLSNRNCQLRIAGDTIARTNNTRGRVQISFAQSNIIGDLNGFHRDESSSYSKQLGRIAVVLFR